MTEENTPFDLLKTYSGLIYRQPLFDINKLDVDTTHLSFINYHGEKLDDDIEVPEFITQLPNILVAMGCTHNIFLTVPQSWQQELIELKTDTTKLIFDTDSDSLPEAGSHVLFARYAQPDDAQSDDTPLLLIDFKQLSPKQVMEMLPEWQQQYQQICAVNVDTLEQFQFCKTRQIRLVQGQFYTHPATKDVHQKTSPSEQTLMELLVKLQEPNVEAEELAATINQDVTLSYKLLRLINSAFFGLPREVSSTKQAVLMLGQNKIKTWASLLCLSGMDNKPNELRYLAMQRARMCELLAKYYKGHADTFFAAGLFSTLDALMDKPLATIVERLPLSDELVQALVDKTGAIGNALQDVLNYEQGEWQAVNASPLPIEVVGRTYLDATFWAKELHSQLQD